MSEKLDCKKIDLLILNYNVVFLKAITKNRFGEVLMSHFEYPEFKGRE